MTLVDAPASYQEVLDPRTGVPHCGVPGCEQTVQAEPCPIHGPVAVLEGDESPPMDPKVAAKLADLAEIVMKSRSVTSAPLQNAMLTNTLITDHLVVLERWGVIGRTAGGTRVPIIHEQHTRFVRVKIIEKQGAVGQGILPFAHLALPPLTAQHRRIIELVADGNRNAKIARTLQVSEDTVKTHLRKIFRLFGAVDRTHLIHIAHCAGVFGDVPRRRPVAHA